MGKSLGQETLTRAAGGGRGTGALRVGRHPSGVRGVASPVGFCSETISSLVASSAFRVTLREGP